MNNETAHLRLAVVGMIVVSLFCALFARLWYLQVLDSEQFVQAAEGNQVRLVYEPAPRGRILDRHGQVLVDNRVAEVITLSREKAQASPEVVDRLAALLGITGDEVRARVNDPRFSPYKPVPVAEDVSKELIVYLAEHADAFPGVATAQLTERTYPAGTLGAHLLGSVGQVNDDELQRLEPRGYQAGDEIGKSGVERAYEEYLRGTPGVHKLEVDSRGRVLRTLGTQPPVQGRDVQLTIDLNLQRAAEESLAQGLEAARQVVDRRNTDKPFVAPAGAAVVLDPSDGAVLALASYPTFDPALFVGGIKSDVFKALQDPATHLPLNNRATTGQYAPGSTFKLVTSIAAMQRGLIDGRTTVDDGGRFTIPNCRGKCSFQNAGAIAFGKVNLARALAVSSDVYYYKLGYQFWTERGRHGTTPIQETARQLGLGEKTGIEISEARGRLADPETRKRLHEEKPKQFPNGSWFAGDNVNLAIGQGEMAITPLQLATAYATFANGGTVYEPRLGARALNADGSDAKPFGPRVRDKVEMNETMRAPIVSGLRGALTDARGTAKGAFAGFPLDQFPIAGKTGTAQVHNKQDTALFASFAPADAPRYVVAVVMEEAGFGGSVAAPVARRIYEVIAGQPPGPVSLAGGTD